MHYPVSFLEIKASVQQETANNAAMEANDVGPKVGDVVEKQGIDQKLHSSADDTKDAIQDEVPVFAIELPYFQRNPYLSGKNTKKNNCISKKRCTFAVRFEETIY